MNDYTTSSQVEIAPHIAFGSRILKSPFFDATRRYGFNHYTIYNHTYFPLFYESTEADYWRLINDVSMWDVSCQRQVELAGPDAFALAQYLSPRDISKCQVGQGIYVPLLDENAGIVNDPVLLRLAIDRFWLSLADSDVLLWAKAIALCKGMDVKVFEPDVSPLAVQGPKAKPLIADLFGDWVLDLKYFWFRETELDGIPIVLARSGWSKQGGYELYLCDSTRGDELWDKVFEAGQKYNIAPGAPNLIERMESGLLSYRSDINLGTNPFEVGLERFVEADIEAEFIGKAALKKIKMEGVKRKLVGLTWGGDAMPPSEHLWPVSVKTNRIGNLSNSVFSPRMGKNIGLALIGIDYAKSGTNVMVETVSGDIEAEVTALPFLPPSI